MNLLEATITSPCSLGEQPSIAEDDRTGSPDHAAGARGTSLALEAVEEIMGTTSAVPAGLSTTALLPEDRTEAVMPLLRKSLCLSLAMELRGWTLLGILRLWTMQGSLVVLAPRGQPHSLSRCLWGRPVLILY